MQGTCLVHHGIKGQRWGVRRFQNEDGTLTDAGKKRYYSFSKDDSVFISGKVKYDEPLNKDVSDLIDRIIASGATIRIGDAPGADTRVQDYLAKQNYKNVVVYTTDRTPRNNVGKWKVAAISGNGYTDEREIRRQKDIAMTKDSTKGFAISSEDDRPDSATSLNIQRLSDAKKPTIMYDYKQRKYIYK